MALFNAHRPALSPVAETMRRVWRTFRWRADRWVTADLHHQGERDRARSWDDIQIAKKRVDLVNCDAPLDGITVPF